MIITLPPELAELRQFCCRDGKRPITRKPTTGNLTTAWTDPESWMCLGDALEMVEQGRKYRHENRQNPGEWLESPVTGIGFLNAKAADPKEQIVGGDIDACRDPITGELSAWARQFLDSTKPFYIEVSPSLCGVRMFYLAHLPNRVDSFTGHGDQEISEETKTRIITSKPKIKEILEKGGAPWNGLELYEAGRHLTITGIDGKSYQADDRSMDLMIALAPLLETSAPVAPENTWISEMSRDAAGKRLPELKILDVVMGAGFVEFDRPGGQIRGSIPAYPSTTGCNIVIDPEKNIYSNMHNGIKAGGDPWVWLAHECGAAPWEVPGEGLLRDPAIQARTLEHAVLRGLVKREDLPVRMVDTARLALKDVAIEESRGKETFWKFSPTKAVESILTHMKLAKAKGSDGRDPIYFFDGRVYVPDGERIVNNVLVAAAGDLASIRNKKETVARLHDILLDRPVVFDHDPWLLGVRNGVVDLRTGLFRGYLPEDLITDPIDVAYDPDATCAGFSAFIHEVAPHPTDQCTLVDWFAVHAVRLMFPYVMFLNGLGRNGKGVYERVLKRFYGENAFSGMALEELSMKNNRFAGADLAGKRGQIVSEAGEEQSKGKRTIPTSFIKNATGDGVIDSDRKNRSRIKFKPFHETTIDSNDMPRVDDMSKGWIERFIKIDMPYHYVDEPDPNNPMERQKDSALFEKLTIEQELSGILNLVIERTIEISKTMTITKRPGEEMFAEYRKQSNSVSTFIESFCEFEDMGDSRKDVFLDSVYEAYQNWCEIMVCDKVDDKRFGAAIKKLCNGRSPERVHCGDQKKRMYRGLRFDANRYQALWDHYKTIRGPLKSITGPLGPLNCNNPCIGENIVVDTYEREYPPKNELSGLISIPGPLTGPDSDNSEGSGEATGLISITKQRDEKTDIYEAMAESAKSEIIGPDSDLVMVIFKTAYRTDTEGKMMDFKEGDKATVARSRAEAWQKRGIVSMDGGE